MDIFFIDRTSKEQKKEQIPCKSCLEILYTNNPLGWLLKPIFGRWPWISRVYGKLQDRPSSKKKINPFIEKYKIDPSEFLEPVDSFSTFNKFFTRKLRPETRPIENGNDVAILPADGRYRVYQEIHHSEGFVIKGEKFSLSELLKDQSLADSYAQGAMVITRLAPVDYHRFHFPCSGTPSSPKLVNGPLYSVNPIALKHNIDILSENKRTITHLHTPQFGIVLYIEIGATNVGSIVQTFEPEKHYAKGDEKGYFSFGGSCIILLFEPDKIQFDQDLIEVTKRGIETLGRFGQSMGRALFPL